MAPSPPRIPRTGPLRVARLRLPMLGVTCLLTWAHASAAAQQAGDIERVPIVLGSRVLFRALPFDEEFYLTGKVGPQTDDVSVWISSPRQETVDCETPPDGAMESTWVRGQSDADSFYVKMGELDPGRSFDMCVVTSGRPTPERLAALRAGWRVVIDSAFRDHAAPWTPNADQLRTFQARLLARLGDNVRPKPGSLLDSSTSPQGFAQGLPAIRSIATAQMEQQNAIGDLEQAADRVSAALKALKAHAGLPRLIAIRTATTSALKAFGSVHRLGLTTAAAIEINSDVQLEQVARGEVTLIRSSAAPLPTRQPLDEVWDADDLDVRGRSLAATIESLSHLRAAIRALLVSSGPRSAANLSTDDLEELDAQTGVALDELAAVENHRIAVATELSRRAEALDRAVTQLMRRETATIAVETHTHYGAETSARAHIAADFGVIYLPDLEEFTPVLGANFYFRPVNWDRGPGGHPGRRFSVSLALTTTSLAKEGERANLFNSFNLALGVGARVTRILRVSAGGLLLRSVDPDPLVDETDVKITPYLGLTLDFVAKDVLSSLFGEIF